MHELVQLFANPIVFAQPALIVIVSKKYTLEKSKLHIKEVHSSFLLIPINLLY